MFDAFIRNHGESADTVSDTIDTNILIGDKSIIKMLKASDLKNHLGIQSLSNLKKTMLLERFLDNIKTNTSTELEPRNKYSTVTHATETVDNSHDTHPVQNGHTNTLEIRN